MNFRILNSVLAVVAPLVLLAAETALSQDKPETPQKLVYSLVSGGCKRSMEVVGTFTDVAKACQAADKLRKTGTDNDPLHVGILTGKADPLVIHPGLREHLKPESCSVAHNRQRCAIWSLQAGLRDLKSAEALVAEIRKSGSSAEVIYHFPNE